MFKIIEEKVNFFLHLIFHIIPSWCNICVIPYRHRFSSTSTKPYSSGYMSYWPRARTTSAQLSRRSPISARDRRGGPRGTVGHPQRRPPNARWTTADAFVVTLEASDRCRFRATGEEEERRSLIAVFWQSLTEHLRDYLFDRGVDSIPGCRWGRYDSCPIICALSASVPFFQRSASPERRWDCAAECTIVYPPRAPTVVFRSRLNSCICVARVTHFLIIFMYFFIFIFYSFIILLCYTSLTEMLNETFTAIFSFLILN